jgi:hypothetical protein
MNTRAKFQCTSVTKSKHWDGTGRFIFNAKMTPVTSGSEENKEFFAATPSGTIELGQFNEELFVPGKEYFVDFTEAE